MKKGVIKAKCRVCENEFEYIRRLDPGSRKPVGRPRELCDDCQAQSEANTGIWSRRAGRHFHIKLTDADVAMLDFIEKTLGSSNRADAVRASIRVYHAILKKG